VYKIGVLASSAEGLSANTAADLIIKKPWERVEEVIANKTTPVQNITTPVENPPTGPTGLVGALTTVNPFAWLGILLAVIGILGWLWYKKPELFKRKKKDTDGGKQS
jgi:predicted outer membrane lipoprotein